MDYDDEIVRILSHDHDKKVHENVVDFQSLCRGLYLVKHCTEQGEQQMATGAGGSNRALEIKMITIVPAVLLNFISVRFIHRLLGRTNGRHGIASLLGNLVWTQLEKIPTRNAPFNIPTSPMRPLLLTKLTACLLRRSWSLFLIQVP